MRIKWSSAIGAGVLLSLHHLGMAYTVAGGDGAVSTATPDLQLGEIVVTAQKRSEKLFDVPISITAVSAAQLNQTASKNLEELQGVIPGVTIPAATAYGGSSIVIRGTSGSGTFLEDDPVAVYVDGIYQPSNSRFGVSDLTDITSVEVVRGPQGTLQGRNATAGAILVRTADPSATLDGFVRGSVATPTEYRIEGAVSLPLTDTFRVRLSADHFEQDGWARNLYNGGRLGGERATNMRTVFVWQPVEQFTARLALDYQTLTNTQPSQRWASTAIYPTGVAVNAANATPFVPLPAALQSYYLDHNQVYNDTPTRNTQRSPSGTLELHYDFGPLELVSLTGVSSASNVGSADSGGMDAVGTNGVSVVDSVTGERRRAYNQGYITGSQTSEELRLQSTPGGAFKWLRVPMRRARSMTLPSIFLTTTSRRARRETPTSASKRIRPTIRWPALPMPLTALPSIFPSRVVCVIRTSRSSSITLSPSLFPRFTWSWWAPSRMHRLKRLGTTLRIAPM